MKPGDFFEMGPSAKESPEGFDAWWESIPDGTILRIERRRGSTIILMMERCGFRFVTPRVNFNGRQFKKVTVLVLGVDLAVQDDELRRIALHAAAGT